MTPLIPCPSPSPGTPPTASRSAAAHGPRPHPEFSPHHRQQPHDCPCSCASLAHYRIALCPLDSQPTPVHPQCCIVPLPPLPGPAASALHTRNPFLRLLSHAPSPPCAETSSLPGPLACSPACLARQSQSSVPACLALLSTHAAQSIKSLLPLFPAPDPSYPHPTTQPIPIKDHAALSEYSSVKA